MRVGQALRGILAIQTIDNDSLQFPRIASLWFILLFEYCQVSPFPFGCRIELSIARFDCWSKSSAIAYLLYQLHYDNTEHIIV